LKEGRTIVNAHAHTHTHTHLGLMNFLEVVNVRLREILHPLGIYNDVIAIICKYGIAHILVYVEIEDRKKKRHVHWMCTDVGWYKQHVTNEIVSCDEDTIILIGNHVVHAPIIEKWLLNYLPRCKLKQSLSKYSYPDDHLIAVNGKGQWIQSIDYNQDKLKSVDVNIQHVVIAPCLHNRLNVIHQSHVYNKGFITMFHESEFHHYDIDKSVMSIQVIDYTTTTTGIEVSLDSIRSLRKSTKPDIFHGFTDDRYSRYFIYIPHLNYIWSVIKINKTEDFNIKKSIHIAVEFQLSEFIEQPTCDNKNNSNTNSSMISKGRLIKSLHNRFGLPVRSGLMRGCWYDEFSHILYVITDRDDVFYINVDQTPIPIWKLITRISTTTRVSMFVDVESTNNPNSYYFNSVYV
jgi:hypothetical protein